MCDARPCVRALTAAALALPSLAAASRASAEDGFDVQFSRYQEGERDLPGVAKGPETLRAETLSTRFGWMLGDRISLALDYLHDTWSGATPVTTAPVVLRGNRPRLDAVGEASPMIHGDLFLDAALRPLEVDPFGQVLGVDTRVAHTISSASPEARDDVGVHFAHEWDDVRVELGGRASLENDYRAFTLDGETRFELDRKSTLLTVAASFTHGDVEARLDHDAQPYIDTSAYRSAIDIEQSTGDRVLREERRDIGVRAGLSRVLSRSTFVEIDAAYVRASGYLANPYRVTEVAFIDPSQQFLAPPGASYAQVRALLERVPDERHRGSLALRAVHHVEALDASLRGRYRFYADDWGVRSHAFELSLAQPLSRRVTLTPRVRYVSQSAASFYTRWLVSDQAFQTIVLEPGTGNVLAIVPFDHALLPRSYSTDYRLSAFGAISAGAALEIELASGVRLLADAAYDVHRGHWKLGGGGERGFADFDAWSFGVALSLDGRALAAAAAHARDGGADLETGAHAHEAHAAASTPAGVMGAHMLGGAGEWMVGLRTMHARRGGDLLRGTREPADAEVVARGCAGSPCRIAPDRMTMNEVMLDVMWAPTRWLNLALMPRFVTMEMELRNLVGGAPDIHGSHGHTTSGLGDVDVSALVRLLDSGVHHLHAGVGIGAPLGSVRKELRRTHQLDRGYIHYGMQLGSGTWDFLPSLTYGARLSRVELAAQLRGVVRLEQENAVGYALGDVVEATAWASCDVTPWLSASGRVAFRQQGSIRGAYEGLHDDAGPMDFPQNYGGRFVDVGVGASARLPSAGFASSRIGLEWMHPVSTDVNGYQLDRRGTLSLVFGAHF